MEQRMETTIREQYGYEAQFNDDNAIVTKAWDKAQTSVSTTVVTGFTWTSFEPQHEKTCLQGLRPGKTQTGLLSYRELGF